MGLTRRSNTTRGRSGAGGGGGGVGGDGGDESSRTPAVDATAAGVASGLAVLTEDEKQVGATVIDMGSGCTSIAVFVEGHLVHADVVPLGGFFDRLSITIHRAKERCSSELRLHVSADSIFRT